jgi:hypothetical protein
MKMNPRALLLTGLAAVMAFTLTSGASTPAYEEQMLKVAVHQSFEDMAPQIAKEPAEIQALLLDYADDAPLRLQARLALLTYPDLAHRILPIYGDEPEFQAVLLQYGEAALPPIAYFMDHEITSLEWRRSLREWMARFERLYAQQGETHNAITPPPAATEPEPELSAEARGRYAIHFLLNEGYDLLGQFTISPAGRIDWVQTERLLEGLSVFFFGGIRNLETRWRQEAEIEGSDLGWAALDVVVIAGSVKLLKALRATKTAKTAAATATTGRFSGRVALFGSRILARGGRVGVSIAKLGAIPAAIYLMFRYPSLINATLAEFAAWLGIEPWLMQFLFWFIATWITFSMSAFLLRPLSRVFQIMSRATCILADFLRVTRTHTSRQPPAI